MKSTPTKDKTRSADLAFEIRGLCSAPPPTDNASPSGAASPHRTGNQHSGHMKASDSFVAHAFLRAVSPFVATSSPVVAHALSVPRRDSSRRRGTVQPKTTKQTQFRRTPVKSTPTKDKTRSADLAFEIRGLLLKAPVAHAFLRAVSPFVATSSPEVRSGHILNRIVQVHPEHFLRHKTFSIENVLCHGKRRMRWTKKSR